MKPLLLFLIAFAACAAVVVAVPHHQRRQELFKACTLGEVYLDVFREVPKHVDQRVVYFLLLLFAGLLGSFYPSLLVLMITWLRPASGAAGVWFIVGGVLAGIGAAVNFLVILLSHMSFGFGGGGGPQTHTAFAWIIPLVQGCFAVASMVIGLSGTCARWVQTWIAT